MIIYETNYTIRKGKNFSPIVIKGVVVSMKDNSSETVAQLIKDSFYLKRALKLIGVSHKESENYTVEKIEVVRQIGETND